MALIANNRIKHQGKWYMPGEELPGDLPREVAAALKADGAAYEGLGKREEQVAKRALERLEALRTEIDEGEKRLADLEAIIKEHGPIADDLAAREAKLQADAKDADAKKAVAEAKKARKAVEDATKERDALAQALDAKRAALAEFE